MSRARLIPLLFALWALCALGTGCGGTEAGNPTSSSTIAAAASPTSPSNGAGSPTTPGPGEGVTTGSTYTGGALATQSQQILNTLCSKLNACVPSLGISKCTQDADGTAGFGTAFGVSESAVSTFQSVIDAESEGSISPSLSASSQCQADLTALSCAEVSGAYSAASPDDFSRVPNLIPISSTSCRGVF